jgi:chorismate mutase/prephenate dehydratase
MIKRRAAYLGPPGTFSHEAAVKFWPSGFVLVACDTAKDVAGLYREKKVDEAVLAIDSSIGGTVGENLDEISRLHRVRIIGEMVLAVHHQLAARPGGRIRGIKTVLAHSKALEECEVWLSAHLPQAMKIPVASSATAARKAGEESGGETAAVASKTAADLYGLKILAADIETSSLNTTRFWILGRRTPPATGKDKTTLLVTGNLNAILSKLVKAEVRILSIYERPSGGKIERIVYFLDVEGHIKNHPLARLLRHFPGGRWLGSYPGKC